MLDEPCLLCGRPAQEDAHWPLSRRYGIATVPLCWSCHHERVHWAKKDAVEALIRKAPGHWHREGTWELYREEYENWVGKRRYLEAVR